MSVSAVQSIGLNTPFAGLVPPLSDEDRRALEADLADGQESPVLIDEQRNILDGHNRYAILGNAVTTKTISGMSEAEKKAFVCRKAIGRRNLGAEQRKELLAGMRAIALELKAEDPQKNTQSRIADRLGVARETVRDWLAFHNGGSANVKDAVRFDSRATVEPEKKVEAVVRVASGETQASVAESLGISPATVCRVVSDSAARDSLGRRKPAPRVDHESRGVAVLELHEKGLGTREIARQIGLAPAAVSSAKVRMGIAETSPGMKLWGEVDHIAAMLEGTSMKVSDLVTRLDAAEPLAAEAEISRCISSLSQSQRTVRNLIAALKRRRQ